MYDMVISEVMDQVIHLMEVDCGHELSFIRRQKMKEIIIELVKKATVCRDEQLADVLEGNDPALLLLRSTKVRVKPIYADDGITITGASLC